MRLQVSQIAHAVAAVVRRRAGACRLVAVVAPVAGRDSCSYRSHQPCDQEMILPGDGVE
jgi:hypothetical protein